MARSDTRYSIYPAPKAVEVVGNTSPALNQAIECWAALLARAMADNSKTFAWYEGGILDGKYTGKWEDMHAINPWGVFAEALKDKRFDPEFAHPEELLASVVEDAHRFDNIAEKWFVTDLDGEGAQKGLDHMFKELVATLRNIDYAHAWALIVAVEWFWEHHEKGIDIKKDPWWTPVFRRQWHQKHLRNKHEAATTDQQEAGKRRNRKKPRNR